MNIGAMTYKLDEDWIYISIPVPHQLRDVVISPSSTFGTELLAFVQDYLDRNLETY